ncbi:molybdopterin-dependent oxidoreductase [Stieleria sp. ICT_E10.1]|uniref:molybdopterin-dependent oxidoreductase n=1 Tax=Stieleria sedimenti TaxID=2976331 RepID=UPI00217F61E8|nr:molybdopterin-dependent oxidoreductase [Stieleria sedimenti]MCS7465876.1 molybdopterin-dependent oxidoreductase [Stieleria sedimenti]
MAGRQGNRRQFLFQLTLAGAGAATVNSWAQDAVQNIEPLTIDNPLGSYPNRDWEQLYRDLYKSDSTFTFLCAPNDTHNCLLNAHIKNGVVTRISPTFGFSKATDLAGNKASPRWEPRVCQKGLALVRRFYGDRRCKRPLVRKGFKEWADAGFPRDPETGAVDADRYLNRGRDPWVAVTWDEAFQYSAKAMKNIAETYSGEDGKQRLLKQGYDPLMVDATEGAGTQTLKFRGGMAALGATRIFAQYRMANSMALLDSKVRGVEPEDAIGARGWDNYSWHTDLPPGHPMVTGQQTVDFDLCNVERSNLILVWGMNWVCTKMPDAHWLTEARMKGSKVVVIAAEYSATTCKADEAFIVRPGTTPALALGLAQVVMQEKLYDEQYVTSHTDLPLLVRMDNGKMLQATDVFPDYQNQTLKNGVVVTQPGEKSPKPYAQPGAILTSTRREEWGDFVLWDGDQQAPHAIHRDLVGKIFSDTGVHPALTGTFDVRLTDGQTVKCRTVYDVTKELLDGSYTPEDVEKLTWAPADAIRSLAKQIAANPEKTSFVLGMGPNQYFNSDLKDRAVFLIAALTRNVGFVGGNVGSYAGNYRAAFFSGLGQYIAENPFAPQLDADQPVTNLKKYFRGESVHYFNHGDTILRYGDAVLTGKTHLPTPSKSIHVSNSNSLIGNAKGHYETVVNTLRRVEYVGVNEWWWTASCEYADVVFPVDSWAEMKFPDMTISVTNPFLYIFPETPLPRIHDTRGDAEVAAGLCSAMGKLIGDGRMDDYWKFIHAGTSRPYLQRILDHSNATRGYKIEDLEAKAKQGIPTILETRTYPKIGGWEQSNEHRPWYTRSGRLEFYRDEQEFMDSGENLIVHREPIDSTFYEPNVIVAGKHPLLNPKTPEDYGADRKDLSGDARQARHVILTVDELLHTQHPLTKYGYEFIFHTPKYRHGAHTTPTDVDIIAVWFGPFGDMNREDRRMPMVGEMYVDMHPLDAKKLGIEEGDYVWIDADPKDRPFHGWEHNPEAYEMARLMARARYYPGTPRGVTRMWHNAHGATFGTVQGAKERADGMAQSPTTKYKAMFRSGSHQSCTRGFIKPTWMTDSLNVKEMLTQDMTQGFVPDVHCPTGAPREAMVKITRAEPGGVGGKGLWRPAGLGLRPTYENALMKKFMAGDFCKIKKA